MRGTKLLAWQIPQVWENLEQEVLTIPENSSVLKRQKQLLRETQQVLNAIAADVRNGLLETVGIESSLVGDEERCSMRLVLPDNADTELIARAIDAENIEAWRDSKGFVHVGINPWYSTKDVDQAVLCTIKVIHVLLGVHATDTLSAQLPTLAQKLLAGVAEIMQIQKKAAKKTE